MTKFINCEEVGEPERFEECMELNFTWGEALGKPSEWDNVRFIGRYKDYNLFLAWDSDGQNNIYRNKIKKVCSECGRELK